jgi:hypothetical protein
MKNKILLLIFLIVNSIPGFSQISSNKDIQNLTARYLNELKQKKVDTICLFEAYSAGDIIVFEGEGDFCEYESKNKPTYIIWKQSGKSFLTKINNCNTYSALEVDAEKIWIAFAQNKEIIRKEKVKPFQIFEIEKGKKRILTFAQSHSNYQNFEIILNGEIKEMRFDDFDFQQYADNNRKVVNINYQNNKNLKSKVIMEEISKVVFANEKLLTKIKTGL